MASEQKPIKLDESVWPETAGGVLPPDLAGDVFCAQMACLHGLTDADVDKLVARIVAARQNLATVKAQMAAAMRRAESDLVTMNFLFAGIIEAYTKERIKHNGGKKSVILPHGTLKTTRVAARPAVENDELLTHWLLEYSSRVDDVAGYAKGAPVLKTTANKAAVLAYVKATGEEIPGVKLLEASEKVCVSVPGLGSVKLDATAKPDWTDDEADETAPEEGEE